jgi:hypothetical protein
MITENKKWWDSELTCKKEQQKEERRPSIIDLIKIICIDKDVLDINDNIIQ